MRCRYCVPTPICFARLDDGNNTATLARSLSFEKRYTLNIVVTDFTDDIDLLFVPIMAWLRVNQPDIMTTDEGEKRICLVR
jgi:hypothetical protein